MMNNISRIVENVINDTINTIHLQLIDGYFYPTNSISRDILIDKFNLERFPEWRFDLLTPIFVKNGYKLAVDNYNPKSTNYHVSNRSEKIGGKPKSLKNPCPGCTMKSVCDSDECGKKNYKLHATKKPSTI